MPQHVLDPFVRHQQFVGAGGEPLAEGGDLGGDVVRPPGDRLVGVLDGEAAELGQRRDDPVADHLQCLAGLPLLDVLGQVARGHPLVDVLVAGQRAELLDPRLDVVAGDALAGRDGIEIDLIDDGEVVSDHLVGVVTAEFDTEVPLSLQHRDPQLAFGDDLVDRRPDRAHLLGRIAVGQHVRDSQLILLVKWPWRRYRSGRIRPGSRSWRCARRRPRGHLRDHRRYPRPPGRDRRWRSVVRRRRALCPHG
ncbi:hypothetical protein SDC9_124474 [bioreactor metagenome]|uniref:Uncharacterized protein n=1 Tax=bioreactor metagenome TaxID=1076179 RepID=A0A645CKI4_9ZZZZ